MTDVEFQSACRKFFSGGRELDFSSPFHCKSCFGELSYSAGSFHYQMPTNSPHGSGGTLDEAYENAWDLLIPMLVPVIKNEVL